MITELLIENVILPFGQSFLYDISKAIYNSQFVYLYLLTTSTPDRLYLYRK